MKAFGSSTGSLASLKAEGALEGGVDQGLGVLGGGGGGHGSSLKAREYTGRGWYPRRSEVRVCPC